MERWQTTTVKLPPTLHRALRHHVEATGEAQFDAIRRGLELYLAGEIEAERQSHDPYLPADLEALVAHQP